MAHSFRHTPIHGICTYKSGEMKWWKRYSNHALRRKVRERLQSSNFEDMTLPEKLREVIDEWVLPPDGKIYDPKTDMRK